MALEAVPSTRGTVISAWNNPSDVPGLVVNRVQPNSYSYPTLLPDQDHIAVWEFDPPEDGWIRVGSEHLSSSGWSTVWIDAVPESLPPTWYRYDYDVDSYIIKVTRGKPFYLAIGGGFTTSAIVCLLVSDLVGDTPGAVLQDAIETTGEVGPLPGMKSWASFDPRVAVRGLEIVNGYAEDPPESAHAELFAALPKNRLIRDDGDYRSYWPSGITGGYEGSQIYHSHAADYGAPYGVDEPVGVYGDRARGRPLGYPIHAGEEEDFYLKDYDSFSYATNNPTVRWAGMNFGMGAGASQYTSLPGFDLTWRSEAFPRDPIEEWPGTGDGGPLRWFTRLVPGTSHAYPLVDYPYQSVTMSQLGTISFSLPDIVDHFKTPPPSGSWNPLYPTDEEPRLTGLSIRIISDAHWETTWVPHSYTGSNYELQHGTVRLYLAPMHRVTNPINPDNYLYPVGPVRASTLLDTYEFLGEYTCHSGDPWLSFSPEQIDWCLSQEFGFVVVAIPKEHGDLPDGGFAKQFHGDLAVQVEVYSPEYREQAVPPLPSLPSGSISGEADSSRARFY